MTITCTITKAGRFDEYGRPLTVGQIYTGADAFVESLYETGYCSVTTTRVFDDDQYPNGSFPGVIPYGLAAAAIPPANAAVSAVTDLSLGKISRIYDGTYNTPLQRISRYPQPIPFDFSDVASYTPTNCTISLDTAKFRTNPRGSMKIVPSTANCNVLKSSSIAKGMNIDTGQVFGIWIYFDSGSEANGPANASLNVTLGTSSSFTDSFIMTWSGNHIRWNQWNYLPMRMDEIGIWNSAGTGTAGVTATGIGVLTVGIKNIQIQLQNVAGLNIWVECVETGLYSRPSIVMGNDAISLNLLNTVLPLVSQYNLPWFGTYNGNAGGLTTSVGFARICKNAGWEIINHGLAHSPLSAYTADADIIAQVVPNWDLMVANGLVVDGQEKIFFYPQNSTHPQAKRILAQLGYKYARGYKNSNMCETPAGFDGLYHFGSFAFENITLKRAMDMIDSVIAYGGSFHFFMHDVDNTPATSGPVAGGMYIDDITTIIKRLATLRNQGVIDMYTPTQFYQQVVKRYL